jgi:hypothetical protein
MFLSPQINSFIYDTKQNISISTVTITPNHDEKTVINYIQMKNIHLTLALQK